MPNDTLLRVAVNEWLKRIGLDPDLTTVKVLGQILDDLTLGTGEREVLSRLLAVADAD